MSESYYEYVAYVIKSVTYYRLFEKSLISCKDYKEKEGGVRSNPFAGLVYEHINKFNKEFSSKHCKQTPAWAFVLLLLTVGYPLSLVSFRNTFLRPLFLQFIVGGYKNCDVITLKVLSYKNGWYVQLCCRWCCWWEKYNFHI